MKWTVRAAVAALGVAAMVVAISGAATAAAGKHPATAHRALHAVAGKHLVAPPAPTPNALPPRYTVVNSGALAAAAGTQTRGTVTCPAKTVPYGGGAIVSSTSLTTNLNSSFPTATGWNADINNAGASADSFFVYAVCAKKNTSYSVVVSSPVTTGPGGQTVASAVCPSGTKVMGGGALSNSGSTAVNMNTTIPVKTGSGTSAVYSWRTDQNNNGAGSATFEAYAVCGHAAGYKIVIGTPVSNPPSSQTQAVVTCPSPKVALSGGGFSSSANPAVDLNSSGPISTNWEVYENNPTTGTPTIAAYAVCAGT